MITRISYTRAQSIGTCGRAYRFRYIDRLEPVATSIAMPFGKAVHGPVTDYVIAHALSKPFDIMANFEAAWVKHTSDRHQAHPRPHCRRCGTRSPRSRPEYWDHGP